MLLSLLLFYEPRVSEVGLIRPALRKPAAPFPLPVSFKLNSISDSVKVLNAQALASDGGVYVALLGGPPGPAVRATVFQVGTLGGSLRHPHGGL
jgi:hypothetical protein